MVRSNHRWSLVTLVAGALALSPACGPTAPAEPTDASTGASTGDTGVPADPTTTSAANTTTAAANTTTAEATTTTQPVGDSSSTSATTTTESGESSSSTTEPLECLVDPAQDLCTEGCDMWQDCCQCGGKKLLPADATDCQIPMGIVTAFCPWNVWNVHWAGENPEWDQHQADGDIILEFLGETCTDYLAGNFTEIDVEVFCEVA